MQYSATTIKTLRGQGGHRGSVFVRLCLCYLCISALGKANINDKGRCVER